jgi:hypothetical protein
MSGAMLVLRLANAQCDPPPSGLVAWWSGEGNANDILGTNNGALVGGVTFVTGEVGMAFNFDGSTGYIAVSNTPSLDFGAGDFTIAGWVQLASLDAGPNGGREIIHKVVGTVPNDQAYFLEYNSGPILRFMVADTANNENDFSVTAPLVAGTWYHVAAVRNGNTNRIYLNGLLLGEQVAGSAVNTGNGGNCRIGDIAPNGVSVSRFFNGDIDELSLYNRALSSNEVASIYASGSAGMCRKPFITSQPQSQVGYWGQSVQFSVVAAPNTPPLSYLWQSNGVAISGAINQTLTLTNLQNSFAAGYSVVVANAYGSVTSAPPANLTINPAGVAIALYPGVSIAGVIGFIYGIQYSTNLSNVNGWIGVTNLTFTQPTQIWYDSVPASRQQRFYRVLQGPIPIP